MPTPVKVYDRPEERKALSPLLIAAVVILVLVIGYFIYRAANPAQPNTPNAPAAPASTSRVFPANPRYSAPLTV